MPLQGDGVARNYGCYYRVMGSVVAPSEKCHDSLDQRRSIIMENHCGNRNPNRYNVVICINKQDEAILPPYTLLLARVGGDVRGIPTAAPCISCGRWALIEPIKAVIIRFQYRQMDALQSLFGTALRLGVLLSQKASSSNQCKVLN